MKLHIRSKGKTFRSIQGKNLTLFIIRKGLHCVRAFDFLIHWLLVYCCSFLCVVGRAQQQKKTFNSTFKFCGIFPFAVRIIMICLFRSLLKLYYVDGIFFVPCTCVYICHWLTCVPYNNQIADFPQTRTRISSCRRNAAKKFSPFTHSLFSTISFSHSTL